MRPAGRGLWSGGCCASRPPDSAVVAMTRRNLIAVVLIAGVVAGLAATPAFDGWRATSIDFLFWLRHHTIEKARPPESSPTVVVAIDEETYRREPFRGRSKDLWVNELGEVLTALVKGGAKVVGFDVIYSVSVEQDIPGFDRDFRRALLSAGRANKLVLGKVQHHIVPIEPYRGQVLAVGGARNVRSVNVFNDPDEVIRRVPLLLKAGEALTEPVIALELAARALDAKIEQRGGGVYLGDWRIPNSEHNVATLNFAGGNDVPSYSFVDLYKCAQNGDSEFFRRNFDGKVVLLGVVLDVEDRKITSKRLTSPPEGPSTGPRCVYPQMTELFHENAARRDTVPGVFIHATAVNNLIERNPLTLLPAPATHALELLFAVAAAAAGLVFGPLVAVIVLLGVALAWAAGATVAIAHAVALPLVTPIGVMAVSLALMLGYRFVVADSDKRFLRESFALYLPSSVVDRLVKAEKPPVLGGETREVTVYFSDIENFSSFAETMLPGELVALMNAYLSAMTEIIEARGGFVDKYIGDAIVAVFGAPLDDADHARHAVDAALAGTAKLAEMNAAGIFGGRQMRHRVGLNSGPALVGNIGSRRRFNYTVMGDAVNLAARLEGANKYFSTSILVSERTRELAGDAIRWREIDAIQVKGRMHAEHIHEPVAMIDVPLSAVGERRVAAYANGLARWRQRDFAGATAAFGECADDPPAARFAARAAALVATPPADDWRPVYALEGK